MDRFTADFSRNDGKIKPLHSVNNGLTEVRCYDNSPFFTNRPYKGSYIMRIFGDLCRMNYRAECSFEGDIYGIAAGNDKEYGNNDCALY